MLMMEGLMVLALLGRRPKRQFSQLRQPPRQGRKVDVIQLSVLRVEEMLQLQLATGN